MAGGSDTKYQDDALRWKERFTSFVADLRADLGNPNLPVIMVVLGTPDQETLRKRPYWQVVREQQWSVNIPGVIKIEADGYERKADGVHFTTRGQLAFGAALASLLPAP
ncbi:MAG: sialate O-acetylesterase [Methyloceanibacter sp.]